MDVETEGFEINTSQKITGQAIAFVHDSIQKIYVVKVIFDYKGIAFEYQAKKQTVSTVSYEDQEIRIAQTKRNAEAEKAIIDRLVKAGLTENGNGFFEAEDKEGPYVIFNWLIDTRRTLKMAGFSIEEHKIEGRRVSLEPCSIKLESKLKTDWFDIKAMITIGDREIAFAELIEHIRAGNRIFSLGNDRIFIIPQEWMTRFKQLAVHVLVKNDKISLAKSNYPLLESLVATKGMPIQESKDHVYMASAKLKTELRPYQREGVQWLVNHYHNRLGACLADDMGLGKTVQTLAVLAYAKEKIIPSGHLGPKVQLYLFSSPLERKSYLKALIVLPA